MKLLRPMNAVGAGALVCCSAVFLGAPGPQSAYPKHTAHRHTHRVHTGSASVSRPALPPGAQVELSHDQMDVRATNVPLSDVVAQIASRARVAVSGPIPAVTVNGEYGPGKPEQVLVSLLAAGRCSYVFGGHDVDGLPKTVVFLANNSGASPPATDFAASVPVGRDTAADDDSTVPGPGALIDVPPNETSEQMSPDAAPQRTERNMERLQHMEEQQSSQAAPQP